VLYLDRRSRLKVRIHGRPRSDRKKSFLLSAVAPSTSTRHPRKARPINWAQRGGFASGGKCSPDAEATYLRASCTPGNQVARASDGPPFRQERRPTRLCRTPGASSGLLAEAALCELGDRVLGGDRIVEHRRVQRAPPPPPSHPRHRLRRPTKADPQTRTDTHNRVRTDRVDQAGSLSLRVRGRLHHTGAGRT
jgi:hypothetical protein